MSNTLANAQLDERLKNIPEQDGVTLHFDHEDACKLLAIIGETDADTLSAHIYATLEAYTDENGGYADYYVDLSEEMIKAVKR